MIKDKFWLAYVLLAGFYLAPLWMTKYLPMTDIPQHAAQISIIKNFENPKMHFKDQFEINWFSPYITGYFLAWGISQFLDVLTSLKVCISIFLLAFPLSLYYLLRVTKSETWWALFGFPFFFNLSFYWGFFNYLGALPIGVLSLAWGWRYSNNLNVKNGVVLFLIQLVLFFSHGLAFLICSVLNLIIIYGVYPVRKLVFRNWIPILAMFPLVILWKWGPQAHVPNLGSNFNWDVGNYRFINLVLGLTANKNQTENFIFNLAGLALIFLGTRWKSWSPLHVVFLIAGIIYLYLPSELMGIHLVSERLSIFVFITGLLVLRPLENLKRARWIKGGSLGILIMWALFVSHQFLVFGRQSVRFEPVMNHIPPHQNVLNVYFPPKVQTIFHDVFLHFPAYYHAVSGGIYDYSFAHDYKSIVRYKPGKAPFSREDTNTHNYIFDNNRLLSPQFNYVICFADINPVEIFPPFRQAPLELVFRFHPWWVYRRVGI